MGTHRSVNQRVGDVVESPFFSGVVGFVEHYWVSMKCFHIRLVISAYISCVLGFSCRMYIDSNHCNSRI
jgi:hypothetical protein